jgi:hypothetical protein
VTFIQTDSVVIVWRSHTALSASVRDNTGIYDIRWTVDGWDCTCPEEPRPCRHQLAVQAIAKVAS